MKQVRTAVTQIGLGIGTVYCFFLIPSVAELFKPSFLILTKQVLAIAFAACLLISPQSLINLGASIAPKLLSMYNIFFGGPKNNKENES